MAGVAGGASGRGFCRLVVGRALVCITDRLGGFWRHVVLIVLGEHLAGDEARAAIGELALCDDAFSFLEQVRQDAL